MSSEHTYTIEHNDFLRGCQVNVDLYRDMSWAILIDKVPAEDLFTELYNNKFKFKGKVYEAISTLLHEHEDDMSISKDDCDVALLYIIIRNLLTSLPPPTLGWGTEPVLSTHISITDDVERMRLSRNHLYAHITRASLNVTELNTLMKEAEDIVERVGQHLCVNGSENSFKQYLRDIRYKDISDQWEIKIKELRDIEIENRKRIKEITERLDVLESAAAVNTIKDDCTKRCMHEARTSIKDDERQGYNIKGKIVKKYSLLKEEMKRDDTTALASDLVLHDKITNAQKEDVEERLNTRRRDAVEKLLKHVLGGDSETHSSFVLECGKRENLKDVCDTKLSTKEMDAFIYLELMDDGWCRRSPDETKCTFTEQEKCLLIKALNDDLKIDVSNDKLLSSIYISVSEHTDVWNCEMGNKKRINKLIDTMQKCDSSVLKTLCEILISLKLKHIADRFEGPIFSDGQSSDSSPSAILKRKYSLCLAQIGCPLNRISPESITFHLAADSNKWNDLKEICRSGVIISLIQQLYQILASNGDLGIGEYRMDVTIYTITHLGTKEAEKAFLHLSTDVDTAASGSDDGHDQLDVRFNPMLDHYDILVEEVDVTRRLLNSLVENNCLAYTDIEETLAIHSRSDQAEHLINKLIGHGQKCFNIIQEHLRVTDKDMFNLLQERDSNLKREKLYAGTFVLDVTPTSTPEGDKTTDKVKVTCMDIINPTCHFQSKEEAGQTLDTESHDNHAEEERLKDETTLDQNDKWRAALVKAYASLMNEMSTETAARLTNLLLENNCISDDQSHIIKRCGFRRETVGNLLHCVLHGDQNTWAVFKSVLDIIPEDITTTEQQEFLRLENLTFENGKRMHHQEPRLRLKEYDVVTLTCNFLSNVTAIDKLNDGLLSKFHFSRQEHEAILNCDRDILYRADLLISTMEQCSENIVEDFLSLLEDVGLDDVVGQLKHNAAKERHEKGPIQQEDTDTGWKSLKWKLPTLRQYLLRKLGFYLDHKTGLGRIELVPRDSEAWTNLEKSGEIENLVPLLYNNLPTHPLLQSSENRVLSLKVHIYDNHCRSRKFVSGRTAILELIETTDEDTTTSHHGLLIDERHNPIEMHEDLLLEGIEVASLLEDLKEEGVFGHFSDIEAAGTRSRSKEMRHLLRGLSPTGRKWYNVLLLNVEKNDPAIFHEIEARDKLAADSREYFTAEVQATVRMQGDLKRRKLRVNNPTVHFKLQALIRDVSSQFDNKEGELDAKIAAQDTNIAAHDTRLGGHGRAHDTRFDEHDIKFGKLKTEMEEQEQTYSRDDESTEYAPGIVSQIQLEMEAFGASEENASKRRHLDRVCTILRKDKKDVVNVWPGYMQQQPQKPVVVVMTKDTSRGQWDTFLGIGIYRRQYDLVSDEAVAVLNSEKVQNNRLSRTEMDHVREVIDEEGDNLFDKHSNITVINGCSYKSKEGGSMLEPTPCVVIHCLVKGIIPFGEDLFPSSIGGIPTDVREGLFYLGLYDPDDNMDGVEVYGVPPDIPVQPGERSVDFNTTLRMGSGVGLLGCSGRGSIGGFVRFQNGDLGFITCAHVFASPFVDFNNINGRLVSQPADDDLPERQHSIRTICGTVNSCIFSGGVGVDAALVKISHDRLPTVAEFVWASPGHLNFAGFDVPPNFNNGRILTVSEINARRNQVVVKFGSSTSVTKGSIYLNGTMVRVSHPELLLQARNRSITFKRQIEICPIIGPSSTFFDLGDSGALVFMLSEGGNELQCIGMAIGFTKTNTCVVTPIEEVFKGLGFPAGQQFNRF